MQVAQSCPTLCDPMDWVYGPWNSPGQNTGVGSLSRLQGYLPNPGIEPRSPALRAHSFPAEPQRNVFIYSTNIQIASSPSPGDLPLPGIERKSPALQADSLLSEPPGKPREHLLCARCVSNAHCRRYTIAITERDTKMIKSQSPLLRRGGWGKGRRVSKERNTHTAQYKGDYNVGNYSCKAHFLQMRKPKWHRELK